MMESENGTDHTIAGIALTNVSITRHTTTGDDMTEANVPYEQFVGQLTAVSGFSRDYEEATKLFQSNLLSAVPASQAPQQQVASILLTSYLNRNNMTAERQLRDSKTVVLGFWEISWTAHTWHVTSLILTGIPKPTVVSFLNITKDGMVMVAKVPTVITPFRAAPLNTITHRADVFEPADIDMAMNLPIVLKVNKLHCSPCAHPPCRVFLMVAFLPHRSPFRT